MMNNSYDSSLEARLNNIERQIEQLKNSLLPIKGWLFGVSVFLAETIVFNLIHSARGL